MKRKKSYCTPSVVTNFPESRKSPNEYEAPQTQNRAIMWQFGIIKAHSHKKNELRGVRNKKVRWWWYFFVYATFFVSMQHTPIKLSGNGLLSSKALRNRSQNFWGVSQSEVMCGCQGKYHPAVLPSPTITGYIKAYVCIMRTDQKFYTAQAHQYCTSLLT